MKNLYLCFEAQYSITQHHHNVVASLCFKMLFLSSIQKSASVRVPVLSVLLRRQNISYVSARNALMTVSNGRRQQMAALRSISHTPQLQAQITVNVPTMGDSIT